MAGGTGTLGVRNLKSIVRYQDRKLPVVNLRGETLFESWDGIFEGRAMLEKHSGLYSFSGKNVLQDDQWYLSIQTAAQSIQKVLISTFIAGFGN